MLKTIIDHKKIELEHLKEACPLEELEAAAAGTGLAVPSFSASISRPGPSVIAEIKYKSPSHGFFACRKGPEIIAESYCEGGAAALSVLTEEYFFAGKLEYLAKIREHLDTGGKGKTVPLLRKDFIFDRYQVLEARIKGASALLLIAAVLSESALRELLESTREAGLEALVEIHSPGELEMVLECGARIIGVNNRNLNTFDVDIRTSFDIARRLESESGFLLVAESGISESSQIDELADAGFDGFLIGSAFMDSREPGEELAELLSGVRR